MSKLLISVDGNDSENEELRKELAELDTGDIQNFSTKGLTGLEATTYVLAACSGVVITQLAKVLINWINRYQKSSVKLNNIEIRGMSPDDVVKIIEGTNED